MITVFVLLVIREHRPVTSVFWISYHTGKTQKARPSSQTLTNIFICPEIENKQTNKQQQKRMLSSVFFGISHFFIPVWECWSIRKTKEIFLSHRALGLSRYTGLLFHLNSPVSQPWVHWADTDYKIKANSVGLDFSDLRGN